MNKNVLYATIAVLAIVLLYQKKGSIKHLILEKTPVVTAVTDKTFAIIKPHAVKEKNVGKILHVIEQAGFDILAMNKLTLDKEQAESFYAVHKKQPFFNELVEMMTSGPVVVMALGRNNAVPTWRTLMGATDPQKAAPGTVRKLFGKNVAQNATHGSDSPENAAKEIAQFFPALLCK